MAQYDIRKILDKLRDDYWKNVESAGAADRGQRTEMICFQLGAEICGFEVRHSRQVIKVPKIVPLPRSPEHILGVINLRGQIISVIDLARRMEIPGSQPGEASKIIIVEYKGISTGFMVDSILNLFETYENDITPPPHTITGQRREFLRGQITVGDALMMILNLGRLLEVE